MPETLAQPEWPGRRVRDEKLRPTPTRSPEPEDEGRLVSGGDRRKASKALEDARERARDLQREALGRIELSAPSSPVAEDALRAIGAEELDAQSFDRAYKIAEKSGEGALGFSPAAMIQSALEGDDSLSVAKNEFTPETAGSDQPLPTSGEKVPVEEVSAEVEQEGREEMNLFSFRQLVGLILETLAGFFEPIVNAVESFEVGILGVTLEIGKWLAWPIVLLYELLSRAARKRKRDARQNPFTRPSRPEEGDDVEIPPPENESSGATPNTTSLPDTRGPSSTSSRLTTIMGAERVLREVQMQASRPEKADLRQALGAYESARELKSIIDFGEDTLDSWSGDPGSTEGSGEDEQGAAGNDSREDLATRASASPEDIFDC